MATLAAFTFAYIFGGLTLIPLLVAACLAHAYWTLPVKALKSPSNDSSPISEENDDLLKEKAKRLAREPDVAASYFAVCREYVPGGVNGKPPERTTPAGETIAAESPSVYQSMYRSIFDRGKTQIPSIEGGKSVKKARNVFFVVLRLVDFEARLHDDFNTFRHGHLLLFDNSDQLEVRHVIALEKYNVDVYGGGEVIPEGELWIKRNCIRISNKTTVDLAASANPMPFFLFSDNCSEKEDFYHALLSNQDRKKDISPPESLLFNTDDMIKLIRQLHTSEENSQTRWLNALLGRLFLAVYKTPEMEELIRMKITKKMNRVPKPAFITTLSLKEIDMGNSAPMLSNPKLKELAIDGSLVVEADIKYTGNFRIVIAAVARIELGNRFKAREVDLVLAALVKKMEGHLLIRIKPPPSNRFWISFETMPKLDLSIEPVVSTRQITYGVILRAIESRVREVIAETVVLPNWDDTPFTDTILQAHRGGIWQTEKKPAAISWDVKNDSGFPAADEADVDLIAAELDAKFTTDAATIKSEEVAQDSQQGNASSATQEMATESQPSQSSSLRSTPTKRPKALRSGSFATAARPVISGGSAVSDAVIHHSQTTQKDAASSMKKFSSKSPEASLGSSPSKPSALEAAAAQNWVPSAPSVAAAPPAHAKEELATQSMPSIATKEEDSAPMVPPQSQTKATEQECTPSSSLSSVPLQSSPTSISHEAPSALQSSSASSSSSVRTASTDKREVLNQTLNNASSAAKKWGLGVLHNWQGDGKSQGKDRRVSIGTISEPIGRGQPLPPPGTPLPKPEAPPLFGSVKRKPVVHVAPSSQASMAASLAASMHSRNASSGSIDKAAVSREDTEGKPPPLPQRRGSNESEDLKRPKKERID